MKGSVLLTGISGFLGSHTAIQLLEQGYAVTGTLRSLDRAPAIRVILARHTRRIDKLRFAQAELSQKTVWHDLMRGAQYVQHVASPLPRALPKHEDELIGPARNGVLHILRAAAAREVQRVVLTSSIGAALYGRPAGQQNLYDESAWTDATNQADTTAYCRRKTIAEQVARDFLAADASGLELATVLPGLVLGPVLEEDFGTSAAVVLKLLNGSLPALPNFGFGVVDVRSVADRLVRAMTQHESSAAGCGPGASG